MSNVVKLKAKKKQQPGIEEWRDEIEEHAKNLMDRIYDQIRLADNDADDAEIPEEYVDSMILAVLTSMLVRIAHARNALGPEALLKLVEFEIEGEDK